ncbi:MAG TPA: DMT family transporter [Anaerolineales bacterium]|nr:DMT family transporter [Anaerolineales bacterium]
MPARSSIHWRAISQALFVTFLWSTSWVLIKIGLGNIPALTFAGLRYSLAFLFLFPFAFNRERLAVLRCLPRREWARLAALGLLLYAVTQGAQFVALSFLPAITVSLLLNFTTVCVALLSIYFLGERPTPLQWFGIALCLGGGLVFFYPVSLRADEPLGLIVALIGVLTNAVSAIMGRSINRAAHLDPLIVTIVSMGVGSMVLLAGGISFRGLPSLAYTDWLIIGWLALANTAFAFTLWNHTLRTLSAVESSLVNSTMLIQIAVLAWVFLGERITPQKGIGMALVALGVVIVQLRRRQEISPQRT